jgi:dihydroxy-acid dehydratase
LALVQNGDRIRVDANEGRIDLLVDESELARRKAAWKPADRAVRLAGVDEKYSRLVGPAHSGAVTHSGGVQWLVR